MTHAQDNLTDRERPIYVRNGRVQRRMTFTLTHVIFAALATLAFAAFIADHVLHLTDIIR